MGDEQNDLAYNFDVFINQFLEQDVDFKMGITTTDSRNKYLGKDYKNSSHFLTAEDAKKNRNLFLTRFKSMIQVGTRGSGTETGLKSMEAYLRANHIYDGKEFLREDAYLAVVIVSDEEEQSKMSAEHYTRYLKSLKKNESWARVYSVVTTKPQARWETTGDKYISVSEQTNGLVSDIHTDFHDVLQNMGNTIVELTKSFALAQTPYNVADLTVSVDGTDVSEWKYDATLNAIIFNDGFAPEAGSEIKVSFQIEQ